MGCEVGRRRQGDSVSRQRCAGVVLGVADDGAGYRVFRKLLGGGGAAQDLGGGNAIAGGYDVRYLGASGGERAGFVQGDDGHPVRRFQGGGAAYQDALPGGAAHAHDDGGGGRQPQSAGAGDDEHRHQRQHGVARRRVRPQKQPQNGGGNRHGAHRRHEPRRHPVGQPLHRGRRTLGGFHQADDLRQGSIGAHPAGAHRKAAGAVNRAGRQRIAGAFVHWQAFAGEGGFVHGSGAGDEVAVHGDLLAGADGN